MTGGNLLSVNADAKTVKGQARGYLTGILYLAPFTSAGILSGSGRPLNVCANATKGCIEACLFTAGRAGIFPAINQARARKTREFFSARSEFVFRLSKDIAALVRKAKRENMIPAVRLNGTSDLAWESLASVLFVSFPDVQFYDYTKSPTRMRAYLSGGFPTNYHLTFSLAETEENREHAREFLSLGGNVAAVFAVRPHAPKPDSLFGFPVIDADATDLRFTDPRGTVAGLSAKGRAKRDTSGFVLPVLGEHVSIVAISKEKI